MRGGAKPLEQFLALDGIRGVLALSVALFHLKLVGHFYDVTLLRHGYLAVDFFFVLSGFVLTHASWGRVTSWLTASQFMVRRFGRVYPLHAAVLAAFVLVEIVMLAASSWVSTGQRLPFDPEGSTPILGILTNLTLVHALNIHGITTWNVPSWSISAEFYTYLAFCALMLFRAWPGSGKLHYVVTGSVLVLCATSLVANAPSIDVTFDYGFPRCLLGFCLGHLTYLGWQRWRSVPSPSISTFLEMGLISLCLALIITFGSGRMSLLLPAIFVPVVWIFAYGRGYVSWLLTRAPILRLGELSYAVYMVHSLLLLGLTICVAVLEKGLDQSLHVLRVSETGEVKSLLTFHNVWLMDAVAVVYVAATIVVAHWAHEYIEQPMRCYFNSVAARMK